MTDLVAVCVPSRGEWMAEFGISLSAMLNQVVVQGGRAAVFTLKDSIIPRVRHNLVRQALASGATHVLFLDSDMVFPPDTLQRLLAHRKPIVGAMYPQRVRLPPQSTAVATIEPLRFLQPDKAAGLVKAEAVGTGLLLVETSVFKRMQPPWFMFGFSAAHDTYCGEDVFFCVRAARELGLPIFADLSFSDQVGHVGAFEYRFGASPAAAAAP